MPRRRTFRSRSRKRPMDWVVQPGTYTLTNAPYVLHPGLGPTATESQGEMVTAALTAHHDLFSPEASRYPQLEQTAVRVVGQIEFSTGLFDITALPPGFCWIGVHFRIGVTVQQPLTQLPVEETVPQYDMRESEVANDDFLWEHVQHMQYNATWWEDFPQYHNWAQPVRIPVDVGVSRRLKQREVLCLYAHTWCRATVDSAGDVSFTTVPPEFTILVEPVLRTLVRTIT